MSAIGEVAVQTIWLDREGDFVLVYVQMQGQWHEAIRERIDSSFSHFITANGLVSEECRMVAWLNKGDNP